MNAYKLEYSWIRSSSLLNTVHECETIGFYSFVWIHANFQLSSGMILLKSVISSHITHAHTYSIEEQRETRYFHFNRIFYFIYIFNQ